MTSEAPGPIVASRENPYSKLAVDILETVRDHRLSMSPNIVGYLKMLVTLGALRHQLAVDYDLPDNVRRFVRRLARQQSLSLLDPRLAMERLYAGGTQVQRALDFVEFLEGQEPTILEAKSLLFGFRRKMRNARRTLIRLGAMVLGVGAVLYLVMAFPDDTRRMLPAGVDYTWVQVGLLGAADPADRVADQLRPGGLRDSNLLLISRRRFPGSSARAAGGPISASRRLGSAGSASSATPRSTLTSSAPSRPRASTTTTTTRTTTRSSSGSLQAACIISGVWNSSMCELPFESSSMRSSPRFSFRLWSACASPSRGKLGLVHQLAEERLLVVGTPESPGPRPSGCRPRAACRPGAGA